MSEIRTDTNGSISAIASNPAATRPKWHRRLTVEIPAEADLYEKLKAHQWNATTEIDWDRPVRNYSPEAYAPFRSTYSEEEFDRLCAQRRAFTFAQLFLGEQAALALCAQLLNLVPEMETKLCLAGQIIDEARHVEVFGRYLDKLDAEAPANPALEDLVHELLDSDHYGEKIVGMQIFLEGIAVGLFQRFQTNSPDPLMRDLIRLVLRDESRHAAFGVTYLADKFENCSAAEKRRVEEFVGGLWRLFHHATGSPFGPVDEFMSSTFADIRHRLGQIGLEIR
ncbi:MAG: ferritin-like domain-containing protein [Myxococcales bacterium]|nr:MAG: ferritin-like domain-containing protein [Myxococcales bacterium]